MATPQINKPDFAYPKTTAENAEKVLRSAVDRGDGAAALNALIVYTIAEYKIDRDELQRSIRLIESTSEKFADTEMSGLFDALLARIYLRFYQDQYWIYNNRQLPLTPLPDDLTEWSGDQFKAKIKELALRSIDDDNISRLSRLPINAYPDIVICPAESMPLFPTLADFVFLNSINVLSNSQERNEILQILDRALSTSAGHPGAQIMWRCQIDSRSDKPYDAYKSDFLADSNDTYSGLYLAFMGQQASTIEEKAQFKALAQQYLKDYPASESQPYVKYYLNETVRPKIEVNYKNICGVNTPLKVNISNQNACKYKINAYFLSETETNFNKVIKSVIKNNKPVVSVPVVCAESTPFVQDTIVTVKLPRAGYYAIVPLIDGESNNIEYAQVTRCIPVLPFSINGAENKAQIVTVEPYTGAPISGANIKVSRDKKVLYNGNTDQTGIADITTHDLSWHQKVTIGYGGKQYEFNNLNVRINDQEIEEDETMQYAQVLTDRSLYHPGEDINVLAVCYANTVHIDRSQTQRLLTDTEVSFTLIDANWQSIDTITATTDGYGRASVKFTVPTDGLTGSYQIQCQNKSTVDMLGRKSVMVSDYKMPDFELTIETIECDTPAKGDVTITGNAKSYSGMPMSGAKLTVNLSESSWFWRSSGNRPFYSTEITTGDDGNFNCVITDSVFDGHNANLYRVVADAVSMSGSTATAEQTFSRTKKYSIKLDIADTNINGEKPFRPQPKVYAANGDAVEIPLVWMLKQDNDTIASGDFTGTIDLTNIKPGAYDLIIDAKDADLAYNDTTPIIIYNVASGIVPTDGLWVKQDDYDLKGSPRFDIDLATGKETTYLYYSLISNGEIIYTRMQKYAYGYHSLNIQLPSGIEQGEIMLSYINDCQFEQHSINLTYTEITGLKIEGDSFRDGLIPGAPETWNLRIVDANGQPLQSAVALDMYNKALDAIYPHSFSLRFPKYRFSSDVYFNNITAWDARNANYGKLEKIDKSIPYPMLNTYGWLWGGSGAFISVGVSQLYEYKASMADSSIDYCMVEESSMVTGSAPMPMMKQMVRNEPKADMAMGMDYDAAVECEVDEEAVADAGGMAETNEFAYRESEVPMAIWAPTLTTDAQGNVQYTFTVPNANTTWRLNAVAWAKDMEVGALMREFVASKPVMVQPNLPRFLRTGDTATVLATVMNATDTTSSITTTIEIFNPMDGKIIDTRTYTDVLDAKQSATVGIDINATAGLNAIGYRVRATNGQYSDGEQNVIRILPSMAQLIETTPFYLNPGEKVFSTKLPKEKDARLSLTFCENPVWTVVSALPGLRSQICEYANSAAAALYSAAVAQGIVNDNPEIGRVLKIWQDNPNDSALVSMLEKNQDLKIALLNSTPWVLAAQSDNERMARLAMLFDNKEINASINDAIRILDKLQRNDGGWAWGEWCNESSEWVTSNVLSMLGDLKRSGWLPKDNKLDKMIERAVKYYDRKVEDTDLIYCLVRPAFNDIAVSNNGKKVINATLSDIRKHWKTNSNPAYKAMQAEALYLNGDPAKAHELMKSLSEFGVYTQSQGLKFPSVNALYDYAIILEAYGLIEPQSKDVDGLRQQLIVRKQGCDWGSAVVTTEVVRSILSTGSHWTVDAEGATIQAGDETITPNSPIETATGSLTADLSQFAGKRLTVTTTGAGPAYGAVYAQYQKQMREVKAASCEDLDIEKHLYVRRGTEWAEAKDLQVGDRVKVQLTIHCKRNLQYVSIIDERPATFEPVHQIPGWIWSEGVGFYRENRDSQTDLHVVYMSPGTYLLTYEMNVNTAGTYSSGVATIQSQYAPEISAHSSGTQITIK